MRLPDWQMRFAEFGMQRATMPFAWGSNDCCSFAAAAVEAITGNNPMAGIAPYDTAMEAARMTEEGGGLAQLTTSLLGNPASPIMAAVGDIVLVVNAGREMLGVCNGVNVAAPGVSGMVALGMDAALAAWKI